MRMLNILLLAALAAAPAYANPLQDELLEADQAFALTSRVRDANTLEMKWKIADGYYLYRDKFKFELVRGDVILKPAKLPAGKKKKDEFFGEVETYTKSVTATLPIERHSAAREDIVLRITVQGCNEPVGVCYPPHVKEVSFALPAGKAAAPAPKSSAVPAAGQGDALRSLGALSKLIEPSGSDEPVDPDKAFMVTVFARDAETLATRFDIADCCYLYRDKTKFELTTADGKPAPAAVTLGPVTLPAGEIKTDEFIGKTEVYHRGFDVTLAVSGRTDYRQDLVLNVGYQGCSEKGVVICYPPTTRKFLIKPSGEVLAMLDGGKTGFGGPLTRVADSGGAPVSEQDQLAQRLASGDTLLTILAFYGFGLLLTFTPCVFPMIPILSGVVVGQGAKTSTAQAFALSLTYVLAMALTYTVAGVLAGMFGANLQVWFQNAWVLGGFAAVFVLLSLSMFGFYELQMPSSVQSKLTEISNRQQGGRLVGAAIMGLLSALIVGPCVTAPLIGALIYIGQTGDAVLGGAALFALSLGMGTLLLAIGTSAGTLLPKAGTWMSVIKAVFGVLMLGVALWLLERVLPTAVTMLLAGILLVVSGIYMGAFDSLTAGVSGWRRLWKGLGLVIVIYGGVMLLGAASGSKDLMQPLKGVVAMAGSGSGGAAQEELVFRRIKGPEGLDQALTEARAQGKAVMLDFYADWCISCKEMEKYTFTDAGVRAALANVVLLQSDVTANDAQDQALLKQYKLIGPPAILFFTASGEELSRSRVVGYVKAEPFATHVRAALGN